MVKELFNKREKRAEWTHEIADIIKEILYVESKVKQLPYFYRKEFKRERNKQYNNYSIEKHYLLIDCHLDTSNYLYEQLIDKYKHSMRYKIKKMYKHLWKTKPL